MIKLLTSLLVLAAAVAVAWGPATHYYMTCAGLGHSTTSDCFWRTQLLAGTEMPDAFFFANQVTPSQCTGLGELHDIVYGSYLVKQAMKEGQYLDLALGFGAHVTGDFAGFYPGGYLGRGGAGTTDWVAVWPFMTAIDSYVAQVLLPNEQTPPSPVTLPNNVPTLDANSSAFMKRARDTMAKDFPKQYPNATAAEILACSEQWKHVVNAEAKKSTLLPPASYQWEMIYRDNFGATTFDQASHNLKLALFCGVDLISVWKGAVMNVSNTPMAAVGITEQYLVNLFKQGLCRPAQ